MSNRAFYLGELTIILAIFLNRIGDERYQLSQRPFSISPIGVHHTWSNLQIYDVYQIINCFNPVTSIP